MGKPCLAQTYFEDILVETVHQRKESHKRFVHTVFLHCLVGNTVGKIKCYSKWSITHSKSTLSNLRYQESIMDYVHYDIRVQ